MSTLSMDSVTCRYGTSNVLAGVYLSVRTGEILGILGRNGSGKSTLFRFLLGLLSGNAGGTVHIDGRYIEKRHRWRSIGYLPQESYLPSDMRVSRAVKLFTGGGSPAERLLLEPRIRPLEHRKVGMLSGGELRYLEFLLVMTLRRPVIVLDEPFSEVEPIYQALIFEKIRERTADTMFLITDHNHRSIRSVCTGLAVLAGGILHGIRDADEDLVRFGYYPDTAKDG